MGFFGIGTGEILLILVLALIIWGPGRLPEIARTLGKIVRTLKKASFDLTSTVTREIENIDNKPTPTPPPTSQPSETSTETKLTSTATDKTEKQPQVSQSQNPERQ